MLILISIISFLAIHAAPNSFFGAGELNPNMTEEAIAALKAVYGLDKPLFEQYIDWVINIFSLNFGISFVTGQDVSSEILKRLPVTLIMNITALIFVFIISLYLGIKSALNYEKKTDYIIRQISLVSFSMPSFYLALLFIIFFSLNLDLFPIAGLHSIEPKVGLAYYLDMAWHLVLPIGVMIFVGLGSEYAKLFLGAAEMYILGAIASAIIFFIVRGNFRVHWLRISLLSSAMGVDVFFGAQFVVDNIF